jgi:MscS family membrane protein
MADKLWFFEVVVGILVLIAVNYAFKRIVRHVRYRSLSASLDWREKMDQIFFLPFHVLLWILGATLVTEVLGRRFDFSFFESYIDAFRSTGFVLCIVWVLLRWMRVVEKEVMSKDFKVDVGFVHGVGKILSIVIIVIALMIILRVWGLDIVPLIAFGGIGAAAVGFAAKDVLSNFLGGLMLHINRPFVIGDFITLPGQNLEGNVEEIGWNLTTVRDKHKRPVYLPNSTFSQVMVVNSARMTHRRIEEKIGVRQEDFAKIPALVDAMKKAIAQHADIDSHLPVLVVLNGFGQSSLELYIDVYTLQTRYDKYQLVKQEILMLVYQEVQKAGAELAMSMMTVYRK